MMRRTSGMANRIQGMYGNRRGLATTGRKILGCCSVRYKYAWSC